MHPPLPSASHPFPSSPANNYLSLVLSCCPPLPGKAEVDVILREEWRGRKGQYCTENGSRSPFKRTKKPRAGVHCELPLLPNAASPSCLPSCLQHTLNHEECVCLGESRSRHVNSWRVPWEQHYLMTPCLYTVIAKKRFIKVLGVRRNASWCDSSTLRPVGKYWTLQEQRSCFPCGSHLSVGLRQTELQWASMGLGLILLSLCCSLRT